LFVVLLEDFVFDGFGSLFVKLCVFYECWWFKRGFESGDPKMCETFR